MYGDIARLNDAKSHGDAPVPKRDPELLFSRIKRMSPKLKPLAMALNSGNGGRREWATARLARASPRADLLLYLTISHGDPMARAAAAEAVCKMVRLGLKGTCVLSLTPALNDDCPYVRWRTIAEIGKMGPKSAHFVKEMFNGLHDPSDTVRVQAAKAIAATYRRPRSNYPDDIKELKELSSKEADPYVRSEMRAALNKAELEYGLFKDKFLNPVKYRR
ncbi:HEAT repeats [uncultured archaeon]|nr:HEAT repeats [uncultured archaeon]